MRKHEKEKSGEKEKHSREESRMKTYIYSLKSY